MKKILCVLMSCLLFVMVGCSGHSKNLKFGAADIGGVYYSIASTFSQLADKEIDGYTFETKATAGSVANLRLISDGYIDLAIVQADLLSDAYNATGTFADKKYQKGYKAVASLYTECCQIVVRKDSGITGIDDLINKTVSVGASESGTEKNAEQILKMSGITDELINKVNMDYTEAAGNTLVTFAKNDNTYLVSVVLKSINGAYADTAALLNYGFDNFQRVKAHTPSALAPPTTRMLRHLRCLWVSRLMRKFCVSRMFWEYGFWLYFLQICRASPHLAEPCSSPLR